MLILFWSFHDKYILNICLWFVNTAWSRLDMYPWFQSPCQLKNLIRILLGNLFLFSANRYNIFWISQEIFHITLSGKVSYMYTFGSSFWYFMCFAAYPVLLFSWFLKSVLFLDCRMLIKFLCKEFKFLAFELNICWQVSSSFWSSKGTV